MSITGFNRRRRDIAAQEAKRQTPAPTPKPTTQAPKRRRKPRPIAANTEQE